MSFSAQTKNELCKHPLASVCCSTAEAYGALLAGGTFSYQEIRLTTEHEAVAKRLSMLLMRAFDVHTSMLKNGRKYLIQITQERSLHQILGALGYDYKYYITYHLNRNIVENGCCAAAFLRGMFLMTGAVASPEKKCHLELKITHRTLCREVMSLMLDMELFPKMTERRACGLLYFKDTTRVEDFLTLIGASHAALSIMEAKVEKNLRNTVNRQVNCETANLMKATDASVRQIAAIERVLAKGGAEAFPEKLRETVHLRQKYPMASLSELAALFEPPISKPGLSHRLRRILAFAEEYAPTPEKEIL